MKWLLAQYNVVRLAYDLQGPELQGFRDLLDPIHHAGDIAPGFVWRFKGAEGDYALDVRPTDGDREVLIAMTVWESVETLNAFMRGPHHEAFIRRREWFVKGSGENVCWWVPSAEILDRSHMVVRRVLVPMPEPTVADGDCRLDFLRLHGPTPVAFTIRRCFAAPRIPQDYYDQLQAAGNEV